MTNSQAVCSTPDQLHALLRGQLSSDDEHDLQAHMDVCEPCRSRLEQTAAGAFAWKEAQQFLGGNSDDHFKEESSVGREQRQSPQIQQVLDSLGPTDDLDSLGRIGGYEITGVIGSGGMGVVLKAHERALDRMVAIKVMGPHLASSGSARKRFAREAKAAAAVIHPNVIAIYGVSNEDSLPYLVMPYVGGTSLQRRLENNGPLTAIEVLRVGSQIAAGLAAAHGQGLVHRDIKPANILMDNGIERISITDFGLARAVDDVSMTRTGVIAGTPQFMSPEQARGASIDHRSDLFSLGSLLYTTCAGRAPFRAETSYGVLRRIIDEQPKPLREINPDIPTWLCQIISKLMQKNPNDRFDSAAQVAELCEDCLAHVQQPTTHLLPATLRPTSVANLSRFFQLPQGVFIMTGLSTLILALLLQQSGVFSPQTASEDATSTPATQTNEATKSPSAASLTQVPEGAKAFGGKVSQVSTDPQIVETSRASKVIPIKAKVHLCKVTLDIDAAGDTVEIIKTISANAEGRFDGFIPAEFTDLLEREPSEPYLTLVVEADGYLSQSFAFLAHDWNDTMHFWLEPTEHVVKGRVIGLDGKPAESVGVKILKLHRSRAKELDALLKQARRDPTDLRVSVRQARPLRLGLECGEFDSVEHAVTDNEGKFELRGTGPNDILIVEFEGKGIKKSWLHVLGRDVDRVWLPHQYDGGTGVYYGCNFTYIAEQNKN